MARTRLESSQEENKQNPPSVNEEEEEEENEEEAVRLKTLAEEKYRRLKLKSALKLAKKSQRLCPNLPGISDMVTSLQILHIYSKSSSTSSPPAWYDILNVEPFSHINSIKKQYKKLALILHPDKNTCIASEEVFKRVSEAFQVLNDKIRRKEYDLRLRIALQSCTTTVESDVVPVVETFWTACSTCRLFHQFERRYIGHTLMCPSCNKSFVAEEVVVEEEEEDDDGVERNEGATGSVQNKGNEQVKRSVRLSVKRKIDGNEDAGVTEEELRFNLRSRSRKVEEVTEMTLAEMQLEAKRRLLEEKKKKVEEMKRREKEEKHKDDKAKRVKEREREKVKQRKKGVVASLEENGELEVMVVEDSDFYDFDKDRTEYCFKKAQIWAVYDDDDGMPRHYGLIDQVESLNPFLVKMSWLDMENNGDERLICWEKAGFHISCGRFKVSRKIDVDSVNVFSHLVQCERVAREVYWIYPRKGSIWALYKEKGLNGEEGNQILRETRSYDIAISLTSYSEMHGLSMAYLEKVDGFKTVFKRQEVGCHAVRWLEKDHFRLFSHQIPAKKLSGTEARDLPKDCWELDPASLPADMLSLVWER
ncbi:hypothetical protein IFM89_026757 [Coptis chinensis]|uniref:J domain-containing protein n=1 Tax=Coptis chinensis TaxID=261450 RepID=A0A835MJA9_9MAGN|nr:hypothetical protein IFM89_026757 [Coptis chinensis]